MNNNIIDPIDKVIGQFIVDKEMFVLRNKHTGQAINASYSEEGLKYTTSANGRLLYFKDARLAREWKVDSEGIRYPHRVYFEGNLAISDDVVVERFIPRNHPVLRKQIAEYMVVSKAYRLLYHTKS